MTTKTKTWLTSYGLDATTLAQFPDELAKILRDAGKVWADVMNCIAYAPKVLLYGPPGTGKSTVGAKHGVGNRGVERFCITSETCWAQLYALYMPGPSGYSLLHGPCVRAWIEGKRAVVDELNEAGGDTIPGLHGWLDDSAIASMTLPDGTVIKPKEGFQAIATMNVLPESLPEALADRFAVRRLVDKPDPHILLSLPRKVRVSAAYSMFAKSIAQDASLRDLTTRAWVQIGKSIDEDGLEVSQALSLVLGPDKAKNAAKAIEMANTKPVQTENV